MTPNRLLWIGGVSIALLLCVYVAFNANPRKALAGLTVAFIGERIAQIVIPAAIILLLIALSAKGCIP